MRNVLPVDTNPVYIDDGSLMLNKNAVKGELVSKVESLTANTVKSIFIPYWAVGFRIYSIDVLRVNFAIDVDPVVESSSQYGNGDFAMLNSIETRMIGDPTKEHYLKLISANSGSVIVSFFGDGILSKVTSSNLRYQTRVINLFGSSLIGYWPLWEASGATAEDISGSDYDAAYNDISLGQPGIGDGKTAAGFGLTGADWQVTLPAALVNAKFSGNAGSLILWVKVDAAADWTDGASHCAFMLSAGDFSSYFRIQKAANNAITFGAAGIEETQTGFASDGWMHLALTWDRNANNARGYYKAALRTTDFLMVNLPDWTGKTLTYAHLGTSVGLNRWKGSMAHAILLDRAATPAEILQTYSFVRSPRRITAIGDSISASLSSWVYAVADRYGDGHNYLMNHAYGGSHIMPDYEHNIGEQSVSAAGDNANMIFVEMGTNDVVTDDTLRAEYEANLLALKSSNPGASIYCLGVLPKTDPEQTVLKNTRISTACTNAGATFWDTTGWIVPATDTSDGLHPNAAGHAKIAAEVLARL
jgi:lysophospholipase L1-like esterase